jgi:hypothetical protein
MEARDPSLAELRAAAEHAALRVALEPPAGRTWGGGEPQRLAELERIAKGAADRLRRAQRAD